MDRDPTLPRSALVGLASAAIVVALMFGLRLAFGVQALPDVAADALTLLLPGSVFGYLIDRLQFFGRPFLLVGLAAGLVALGSIGAAVAGRALAGRPRWWRAGALSLALSAVTLPLVLVGRPAGTTTPPAIATVAYWVLFALLVELGLSRAAARPMAGGSGGPSRRALLYAAGAVGSAWLASYFGGRLVAAAREGAARPVLSVGTPAPTPPGSAQAPSAATGSPPAAIETPSPPFPGMTGITSTADFYVVTKNGVGDPDLDAARWRLQVGGARPYVLSYDDLRRLPAIEGPRTLECISNIVGGPLISTAVFRGVPLRDLLEPAGLAGGVREISFTSADGYTESVGLEQALDPRTIVAYAMNGGPLPRSHGFPARLLMSGRYGMKNPKWLTAIVPVAEPFFGYWELRGWNKAALVHTMSRLDFPQESDRVPAGKPFPSRGVAYAGSRGVSKVEVSFDGGRSWQGTQLRRILPKDDWMPFTFVWTPSSPGTYPTVVRATDGDGRPQDPADRDSFPNGSTGYHRVAISVT